MLTREQIEEIQSECREEKAYPEIKKFETWMEVNLLKCPPKSLMEKAISYTYNILKKLSLYVTDGRYKIDDNMVENSIRPLAKAARTICSAVMTRPPKELPWSTPCLPPARLVALMKGLGSRTFYAGSRNTNRARRTSQNYFPATEPPTLSNIQPQQEESN